ncbi:MAG: RNHCP domain-containing protein [Acidimicrobiia bacterium]
MAENFKRNVEDFTCLNCGETVHGNGYTDHCPKCLYSQHVDVNPGDRAALETCGGLMKPINIAPIKGGYKIFYTCEKCGYEHSNKSSHNDDISSFIETL